MSRGGGSILERELARVSLGVASPPPAGAAGTSAAARDAVARGKPPSFLKKLKGSGRASIVYEPRQAQSIGVDDILDRAENGLMVLCQRNRALGEAGASLFSRQSLHRTERGTLVPEQLAALNASIARFLQELCPHILEPEALDCLEYLVRKYDVHIHNVQDVVMAVLPYHMTDTFKRVVRILYVKGTRWAWLEGLQSSTATFHRALFAKECVRNKAFLSFMLQAMKALARDKRAPAVLVSFLCFTLLEFVHICVAVDEELLVRILSSCIFPGLARKSVKESRCAAMMILLQLAKKVAFSEALITCLFEEAFRTCAPGNEASCLEIVVCMAATQSLPDLLPEAAVHKLVACEGGVLAQGLRGVAGHPGYGRTLAVLVGSLMRAKSAEAADTTTRVLAEVDLSAHLEAVLEALVLYIREAACDHAAGADAKPDLGAEPHALIQRVMRQLDAKYGSLFDGALNAVLSQANPGMGNVDVPDDEAARAEVAAYVAKVFAGSMRRPLRNEGGETVTLFAALDSPVAATRKHAMRELCNLPSDFATSNEAAFPPTVRDAVLRRLHDEDASICKLAFGAPLLAGVDARILIGHVGALVKQAYEDGSKAKHAKFAMKYLLKHHTKVAREDQAAVASALVPFLLIRAKHRKLGHAIYKYAAKCSLAIFSGVRKKSKVINEHAKSGSGKGAKGSKGGGLGRDEKDGLLNVGLVKGLADAITRHSEYLNAWSESDDGMARHVWLLVLYRVCREKKITSDQREEVLSALCACLKDSWKHLAGEASGIDGAVSESSAWQKGLPPPEHFKILWEDFDFAHASIVSKALLAVLEHHPSTHPDFQDTLRGVLLLESDALLYRFGEIAMRKLYGEGDMLPMRLYYQTSAMPSHLEDGKIRRSILQLLHRHCDELSVTLTRVMEERAVAKKRHSLKKGSNKNASDASSEDTIDVLGHIVWLVGTLCEENEWTRHKSLDILKILLSMLKSGFMKESRQSGAMQSEMTSFLADLVGHSVAISTGHANMEDTMQGLYTQDVASEILGKAEALSEDELTANIVRTLSKFGSWEYRAQSLEGMLSTQVERYATSSQEYNEGTDLTPHGASLLANLLKAFHTHEGAVSTKRTKGFAWFAHLLACLHFPSRREDAWRIREAAVGVVNESFVMAVPSDQRVTLFHSLAFLASKDDNAAVQKAAKGRLESISFEPHVVSDLLRRAWLDCSRYAKDSQGKKTSKRAKKGDRDTHRFAWVQHRMDDAEHLGLRSTLLALEVLGEHGYKIPTLGSAELFESLLSVLEFFASLGAAFNAKQHDADVADSATLSVARAASNHLESADIEASSSVTYGMQLGLQYISSAAHETGWEKHKGPVLKLALVALRLVEDGTVQELSLALIAKALRSVSDAELSKSAGEVLEVLLSVVNTQPGMYRSNLTFLKSVLGVLKPFLAMESLGDSTSAMVLETITAFTGSDQHVLLGLLSKLRQDEKILLSCLRMIFGRLQQQSTEQSEGTERLDQTAASLCQFFSVDDTLRVFSALLADSKVRGERMLNFILREITERKASYASAATDVKKRMLRDVCYQTAISSSDGEVRPSYESLFLLVTSICSVSEYLEEVLSLLGLSNKGKQGRFVRLEVLKLLPTKFKHGGEAKRRLNAGLSKRLAGALERTLGAKDGDEDMRLSVLLAFDAVVNAMQDEDALSVVGHTLDLFKESSRTVHSSVLVVIGTSVTALRQKMIPLVPRVAESILSALDDYIKQIIASKDPSSSEEGLAVVKAALNALHDFIGCLGSMVAPYLSRVFETLKLSVGLEAEASVLMKAIVENIPVRITLPVMLESLASYVYSDATSYFVTSLGEMVQLMDHPTASLYCSEVVGVLLRLMDRRRAVGLTDQAHMQFETSLITVLGAMVMKLSEASFRPIFFHILDWSTKGVSSEGDVLDVTVARGVSLLRVAIELSEQLRSIFVPYFKHLMDACLSNLKAITEEPPQPKAARPKRRKVGGKDGAAVADAATARTAQWVLHLLTVHALKKCFAYDTVEFTDESHVSTLVPALVRGMDVEPKGEALLRTLNAFVPEDLGSRGKEGEPGFLGLDVVAHETADCLFRCGIAAGEEHLKIFNMKILMASRSEVSRAKLICIEVVSRIVHHLREDYLVLITEAWPFIVELIEDPDLHVQNDCKPLAEEMQRIAGEDLI